MSSTTTEETTSATTLAPPTTSLAAPPTPTEETSAATAVSTSTPTIETLKRIEATPIKSAAVKRHSGSGTTRCLKIEAQRLMSQRSYPLKGKALTPSLSELKATTFSDYVRQAVLNDNSDQESTDEEDHIPLEQSQQTQQAIRRHDTRRKKLPKFGKEGDQEEADSEQSNYSALFDKQQPSISWSEGMAKVTMPEGWYSEDGIAQDRTARGPGWQVGTSLGDMSISDPIQQIISGIGGIYEYTLLDRPALTLTEFRDLADAYRKAQVGNVVSDENDDDTVELLARKFWKRVGPTMPPAMYGADMEGTLFEADAKCLGWNLSQLDSCLQVLASSGHVPGVTTPYLYIGMWASVFCAHTEDMNLLSINYLHAGAPKIWYAVAPGEDSRRFESLCESHFAHARRTCPEFLRHKRYLLSPAILLKAGIPFTMHIQRPGDAIITFPGSYHFGFNTGFNVAEATNFAVPEWIPYGLSSRVCLCRHDSVRIDMKRFHNQLDLYEKDRRRAAEMGCKNFMTWREWSIQQSKRKRQKPKEQPSPEAALVNDIAPETSAGRPESAETGDNQKDEIPPPPPPSKPAKRKRPSSKLSEQQKKREFWVEVMQPISSERTGSISQFRKRSKPADGSGEVWHLAKPVLRRLLKMQTRVLCIVPVLKSGNDDDSEDEECFRGIITEMSQDHVRVHFDGLQKKEDIWIPMTSSKLFIDGGQWTDDHDIPVLHFWQEEDSRKKCL